jgi:hypothetical protein
MLSSFRVLIVLFFLSLSLSFSLWASPQSDMADLQREIEKERAVLEQNPNATPSPKLKQMQSKAISIQTQINSEAKKSVEDETQKESKNLVQNVLEHKGTFENASGGAIKVIDAMEAQLSSESNKLKEQIGKITDHRDMHDFLSKVGGDSEDAKRVKALNSKLDSIDAERNKIKSDRGKLAAAKTKLEKIGTGLNVMEAANNLYEGNYLDGSEGVLNLAKEYLPDQSGKIKALDATTKLLGETSGGTKAINKKLGSEMGRISEYSEKLKKSQAIRDKIDKGLKVIGKLKQAKELFAKAEAYNKQYQELKDDGTTSAAGRNLIMGMDVTGEAMKKLAGYLPPGASDFVEFYADAMKLPGTVNKVAKNWYKDRDEAVNVSGPLAQTKAGREYDGILDRDPEINPSGGVGVYYDPNKHVHVLITDPDKPAIVISQKERDKIAQIQSDMSAAGKTLTNGMIEELRKNGYQKIVIPGMLSNEEISIKELAKLADEKREEARIKSLASKALGVKNPSKKEIEAYKRYDDLVSFSQRRYNYHLSDEQKKKLFAKYQEDPKGFADFLSKYGKKNENSGLKPKLTKEQQDEKKFDEEAEKFGIHKEDLIAYKNCMCRDCGGSLGGNYNPNMKGEFGHGPCQCNGPLTIWKTPYKGGTEKKIQCFNSITRMNYLKAQAIFDQWNKELAKDNAESVKEELKETKNLIKTMRSNWEEEALMAAKIFRSIRDLLFPQDIAAVQSILTPRLRNIAHNRMLEGNLEEGIKILEQAIESGGNRVGNAPKDLEQYKKWVKPWNNTRTKDFPAIRKEVNEGKIETAQKKVDNIAFKTSTQGGNQLPPLSSNKEWNELRDSLNQKKTEMEQLEYETRIKATNLAYKEQDPLSAVKVIDTFPKTWEINQNDLIRARTDYVNQYHKAQDLAYIGDGMAQRNELFNALGKYQESLKLQKDPKVQSKADDLLKRQKMAGDYNKKGWAALDKSDLSSALESFEASVKQWPDPNISQLIGSLRGRLQEQKRNSDAVAAAQIRAERDAQKRKDDDAMTASGLSLTERFTGRDSGRDQVVGDRNSFDSYNTPDEPSNSFGYEQMTGKVAATAQTMKTQAFSSKSTHSSHNNDWTSSASRTTAASGTTTAAASSTSASQTPTSILNTGNIGGVQNNPTQPTTFTTHSTCKLISITNYHWNNAKGSKPGSISVRDSSGKTFGPWSTTGKPGQGGVVNAYWVATPNISLPAGTYTIVDSESSTWAHNSGSGNKGMSDVVADCGSTAASSTSSTSSTGSLHSSHTPSGVANPSGTATTTATNTPFSGTMTGSWQGSGGFIKLASGSFTMSIAANGQVTVRYDGDDSGSFTGNISNTGNIDLKMAGGSYGAFSWKGTIKKDSKGNLTGNGTWSDDDVKGTWQSKGTMSQPSTSHSNQATAKPIASNTIPKVIAATGRSGNTQQTISLAIDSGETALMKLKITQASELTAKGQADSSRIGEVTFYAGSQKVKPKGVTATSVYGKGYSASQIIDGDPTYQYMTSGAKGWASSQKTSGEDIITFTFSRPYNITKVVITTAPTQPYRLHSFSIMKYQ